MKVSVKDCLQLEAFRKCIVVAGEKHMDRRVKAVSVMDAATAEEAVKCSGSSGNMVLTSFAGMKHDVKQQQETIRELAKAGVAALVVFRREQTTQPVDKAVTRAADEAGLP